MMTLLLGGARSGKSALALELASTGAAPVIFLATGEESDDEMARRIALHRSQRPSSWRTVEEPVELEKALRGIADGTTIVVDCLTLWVANLLEVGYVDEAAVAAAGAVAALCTERPGKVIVVSNEVGSGIVPTNNFLSRRYRDLLGRVNMVFAERAVDAFLVVAGRVVPLLPAKAAIQ